MFHDQTNLLPATLKGRMPEAVLHSLGPSCLILKITSTARRLSSMSGEASMARRMLSWCPIWPLKEMEVSISSCSGMEQYLLVSMTSSSSSLGSSTSRFLWRDSRNTSAHTYTR